MEEMKTMEEPRHEGASGEEPKGNVSRRNFIKGVIAAGAAVSSASYLFRTNALGQTQAPGAPGSEFRIIATAS